ncbi:MAG: SHD1 domain-containing protein [Verrucomicrobiota bacterium]
MPRNAAWTLWLLALGLGTGSARTWTDRQGRQLEGELIEQQTDRILLRLDDSGKTVPVPLALLSDEDLQYLQSLDPGAKDRLPSPSQGAAKLRGADFGTPWPSEVRGELDIPVEELGQDESGFYLYRTPHFEFQSEAALSASIVREFSRIFETTRQAIAALPLALPIAPEPGRDYFTTRLFRDRAGYFAAGGPEGSAGVYLGREKLIMIPLENLGVREVGRRFVLDAGEESHTLIHEIVHQVTNRQRGWPTWLIEGLADYIASTDYRNARFSFTNKTRQAKSYLEERRGVDDRNPKLPQVHLLLEMSPLTFYNSANSLEHYAMGLLLFLYFAHLEGDEKGSSLQAYLAALENKTAERKARQEILLGGQTLEAFAEDFLSKWRSAGLRIDFY